MTEKHIWKNGETITADLLNGMSSYVDDKVNEIPAGGNGENLIANSDFSAGFGSWRLRRNGGAAITMETDDDGKPMAHIHSPAGNTELVGLANVTADNNLAKNDSYVVQMLVKTNAQFVYWGIEGSAGAMGDISPAINSNWTVYSRKDMAPAPPATLCFYFKSSTGEETDTYIKWVKLEHGLTPTPYSKKTVTDVGNQLPDDNGHIDMSGYVLKADITTLNNKISSLEAQLSGG